MTGQSQTLYRKWRSQTFAELIGQEAVAHTLRQAVAHDRLAHAYLFCGPRGTGKTSSARLLAKMINCEHPQDGEPCNICNSCREITEGRSTDVIEIDAASNRGIDEIRDLRDRVRVASATGKTRLFIVDEIHMLTEFAFNALLKTLEEPPPKVIFVLATTDPQKIPETVLSRCQRFDFRRISLRDMMAHLRHVAGEEGMTIESGAVEVIARAARGGMRDALSLLDQVRAFAGETISTVAARQMLGLTDPSQLRDLIIFVAENQTGAGLHRINELAQSGVDLRQLGSQIGELWRQLMLARAGADIAAMLDLLPEDGADLRQLAARFDLVALTECARIFSHMDAGPHTQVVPQLALELAFLDCVAALRQPAVAIADRQATYVAPRPATPSISQAAPPMNQAAPPARETPSLAPPMSQAVPPPREATPPPAPAATVVAAPPVAPALTAAPMAPPMPARPLPPANGASKVDVASSVQLRTQWETFRQVVKQRNTKAYAVLANAHCSRVEFGEPAMAYIGAEFDFHHRELTAPDLRETIEWALHQLLKFPCRFTVILEKEAPPLPVADRNGQPAPTTPILPAVADVPPFATPMAEVAAQPSQATTPDDPQLIAARDPVIQNLQANFGGTIRVVSVQGS